MTLKEGIYEIRYVPEHIKLPFMSGDWDPASAHYLSKKKSFLESQSDGDHSGIPTST